jgi:hypothetical protein
VSRSRARPSTRSLPEWALARDAVVFLNIPMDAETPRWVCWALLSAAGSAVGAVLHHCQLAARCRACPPAACV